MYLKSKYLGINRRSGIGASKFAINLIGFNALLGGYAYSFGGFDDRGSRGVWWTSSLGNGDTAKFSGVYSYKDEIKINEADKSFGLSVRCIKD
jgi:uncharacterized protein (TIGR02145 family)